MEKNSVLIRSPGIEDIPKIVELVKTCSTTIFTYIPYYYWINIQYFASTCAIAVTQKDGVVGWCSMLPVSKNKYFLHQIGVAPSFRQQGIATKLTTHLANFLREKSGEFVIELTIERDNIASFTLFESLAKNMGCKLVKYPQEISILIKQDKAEDLYAITKSNSAV